MHAAESSDKQNLERLLGTGVLCAWAQNHRFKMHLASFRLPHSLDPQSCAVRSFINISSHMLIVLKAKEAGISVSTYIANKSQS